MLLNDPKYVQWFMGRPWVRPQYPDFYLKVVNNNFYGAPVETPEHNSLQVLFLDDGFCAAFVEVARPQWAEQKLAEQLAYAQKSCEQNRQELVTELNKANAEIGEYEKKVVAEKNPTNRNMLDWHLKLFQEKQQRCEVMLEQLAAVEFSISHHKARIQAQV